MKYKCLILDHDDTCVDSTASHHYPAHVEVMRRIRPGTEPVDLATWFEKNCEPGVTAFLSEELGFSPEEMELEYRLWREFIGKSVPDFYPGIPEFLREFRRRGGIITVVSHSNIEVIEKFYTAKAPDLMPDLIFGWDDDPERRKPHPWPARQILRRFGLEPGDALMVDDLVPGIEMARLAEIPSAGAGWGHQVPAVRRRMVEICLRYFTAVEDLAGFVLA